MNLRLRVTEAVQRRSLAAPDNFPVAEIQAACVLSNHDDVHLCNRFWLDHANVLERRNRMDGSKLTIQVKMRAQVVDKASSAGSAEYGTALVEYGLAEIDDILRQGSSEYGLSQQSYFAAHPHVERASSELAHKTKNAEGDIDNLQAYPFSGQDTDYGIG